MIKNTSKMSNSELEELIRVRTEELITLRKELDRRRNDKNPLASVDFTSYITK